MKYMSRLAYAVALLATVFSVPLNAQGQGMVMANCAAETSKYCADVPHGAGEVPKCLEKHMSELSDACKAALESRGPGMGRMQSRGPGQGMVMANCAAETSKYCADVPHGAGEVPKCLEKHMSELSDACKAALENRGPGMGRMQNQ